MFCFLHCLIFQIRQQWIVVILCLPHCLRAHSGLEALEATPSIHEHPCARVHGAGAARSPHAGVHGDPDVWCYVGNGRPPLPTSPASPPCRPGQERKGTGRIRQREQWTEIHWWLHFFHLFQPYPLRGGSDWWPAGERHLLDHTVRTAQHPRTKKKIHTHQHK